MAGDPQAAVERRVAVRHLVQRPLTCREHDPDVFRLIRRHEADLDRWFTQRLGYRLHVDADTARLFKAGAVDQRPLRAKSGRPFHKREYVLLALVLAATAAGPGVVSLRDLVDKVRSAAAEAEITLLGDSTERRAFVTVLRWMIDHGLATELHEHVDAYADDHEADAVLKLRPDRIVLVTAPPLIGAAGAADLLERSDRRSVANRQWMRSRLVEDPVLYRDGLTPAEWGELRRTGSRRSTPPATSPRPGSPGPGPRATPHSCCSTGSTATGAIRGSRLSLRSPRWPSSTAGGGRRTWRTRPRSWLGGWWSSWSTSAWRPGSRWTPAMAPVMAMATAAASRASGCSPAPLGSGSPRRRAPRARSCERRRSPVSGGARDGAAVGGRAGATRTPGPRQPGPGGAAGARARRPTHAAQPARPAGREDRPTCRRPWPPWGILHLPIRSAAGPQPPPLAPRGRRLDRPPGPGPSRGRRSGSTRWCGPGSCATSRPPSPLRW